MMHIKKKTKKKKDTQLDIIARNVSSLVDSMEYVKGKLDTMATKDELQAIRSEMSTKADIDRLEEKLVEDTDAVTGVEQKHFRSHAQRIARLEKAVFSN